MAAIIQIDDSLNLSEEVSDFFLFLLNENVQTTRRMSIPEIMLTKIRPGLSSELITSAIISRFSEAGIPSGPLVGGTPNVMEIYTKIIIEEIVDAIQNDMRIDVVTDPGATIQAAGANSGGPVISIGATVAPYTGTGVAV